MVHVPASEGDQVGEHGIGREPTVGSGKGYGIIVGGVWAACA